MLSLAAENMQQEKRRVAAMSCWNEQGRRLRPILSSEKLSLAAEGRFLTPNTCSQTQSKSSTNSFRTQLARSEAGWHKM